MNKTPDKLWVRRRTEFNHDWLKNNFIPALARFLNILDDEIRDPNFQQYFLAQELPEWRYQYENAQMLLTDVELMMSPKCLFDGRPLSNVDSDTILWLPDVIHELWLTRCHIKENLTMIREALARANETFSLLCKKFGMIEEKAEAKRELRNQLYSFNLQCQSLGSLLSLLPSYMKVV